MYVQSENIVVRGFVREDAARLYSIVREPGVRRFMPDWAEGYSCPQDYHPLIDWFIKQQDQTDISIGRRYVVALPEGGEMIGVVGVGLEETLNEVEVAYFMAEAYQRKGYMKEAVDNLVDWCFKVSEIPYLILTIDCANGPSNALAEKCGFRLFERRTPIGHKQPNMESDDYFYYRKHNGKSHD